MQELTGLQAGRSKQLVGVTTESAERLGLAPDTTVWVSVKATEIAVHGVDGPRRPAPLP